MSKQKFVRPSATDPVVIIKCGVCGGRRRKSYEVYEQDDNMRQRMRVEIGRAVLDGACEAVRDVRGHVDYWLVCTCPLEQVTETAVQGGLL